MRLGTLGLLLVLGFSTELFSNLWGLLIGNGYVIPNQSSVFTFKATKMNEGSGDYWLYGQDRNNYYTTLVKDHLEPYTYISKYETESILGFDKINYNTWWNPKIPCNDLLSTYAKKPIGLEFIKCERLEKGQTIAKAIYRVSGEQSKEIEDFLIKNYGMGNLKWVCCGWETSGKYGGFEHSEFKKIDSYCSATIDMYASGEVEGKNDPTEIKLETDRNKIDYFTVVVTLVIV
ncbi:DUF4952 domain-containing protein [Flavivirga algicola]|uniref:DUF4952 domain-containing protein n=1 Tax=Flavivirga algicola TaxID=2729136 RepID=A0ABX1RWK6_9FLAO|nr:DUF4952 domain-containing protein [Flavivirga algicola]NMH86599.1 DUF4952 domain-containing protein [Flavivirga algicola]